MLTVEEQLNYDSFTLASPSVTKVPLWKFAEDTPSGSQSQSQAQSITPAYYPQPQAASPLGARRVPSDSPVRMQALHGFSRVRGLLNS